MEFIREKAGKYHESLGKTKLYVNDKVVAEGADARPGGQVHAVRATVSASGATAAMPSATTTMAPGTFKGGTILGVGVTIEKEQYLDLEKMAAAAFAVD